MPAAQEGRAVPATYLIANRLLASLTPKKSAVVNSVPRCIWRQKNNNLLQLPLKTALYRAGVPAPNIFGKTIKPA